MEYYVLTGCFCGQHRAEEDLPFLLDKCVDVENERSRAAKSMIFGSVESAQRCRISDTGID
jgi:hypothetical protein